MHDDHVFLEEIALVRDARGRGIGTQLIRDVQETGEARGLAVRLSVLSKNARARDLYERLGFWIHHVEPPRVKMEWIPDPTEAVFGDPDQVPALVAAIVAADEEAIADALTRMFIFTTGAVWEDLDCINGARLRATSQTCFAIEGEVYPFVEPMDPYRITLELSRDHGTIEWLALRWRGKSRIMTR